jgi:hypothetical protein
MDSETSRKINELANNLKKLHLAATMEEALARAAEMLTGAPSKEKTIGEMMQESKGDSVENIEKDLKKDEKAHDSQDDDIEEVGEETEKLKKGVENAKEIIDEAEHVQKHEE